MSSLAVGAQFGPYEVLSAIGAGGMGEVYRARDTRLNRYVALKVLPAHFAGDPDRLARFKREAQLLAALNHPNIAAIHGFEDSGSTQALVLELVEGPTVADRIAHGPLPLDEAMPIARQIAEALEAAHEQGIIHRDLKPANIKVREDGTVKVLDFGLAKALAGDVAASPDMSMSPTLSVAATAAGVILGTAAYMAPEQARGKAVDRCADVWAFGCVLYEMLTGKRAFGGDDVADTLAAVLRAEPDFSIVPPRATRLLRACLDKDRKRRLQSIVDYRLLIDDAPVSSESGGPASRVWAGAALVSIVLAVIVSAVHFLERLPLEPTRQLDVAIPADSILYEVALSPDGRQLVAGLNVNLSDGGLWRRPLDQGEPQKISGTGAARMQFFSPDSRFIGFFSQGKLKTVPATGGSVRVLCDAGGGGGGTWNADGLILFATESGSLVRVDASSGDCTTVATPSGDARFRMPAFLPDGRHFLYVVTGGDAAGRGVYVAALDEPSPKRLLLDDESSALFAPSTPGSTDGHLLFLRDNVLMASAFNAGTLMLENDPVPIARDASFNLMAPQVAASVAAEGTLAYVRSQARRFQLTWLDRAGNELSRLGRPEDERHVAFAPDERTIAKVRSNEVWLHDLVRDVDTRFAIGASSPVWSPDGSRIALASGNDLYVEDAAGGSPQPLVGNGNPKRPSDWSADGQLLFYTEIDPKTQADIWVLRDPGGEARQEPQLFLRTPFTESQARISRDGRWVAYSSNESGNSEVYVRSVSAGSARRRVSTGGGQDPAWRGDGRELYYLESAGVRKRMMAVPITAAGDTFEFGKPQILFEFPVLAQFIRLNEFVYSPTRDGSRFLVNLQVSGNEPTLNVITNWQQRLSTTAP